SCFLDTGYVYNTEAHPIDIGSLDCCTSSPFDETSSDAFENDSLTKEQIRWLGNILLNQDKQELHGVIKQNYSLLTCSALTFEQRFSLYGEILT
ncbi:unnamed protein product, partial [Rotaria magnacalcarata]